MSSFRRWLAASLLVSALGLGVIPMAASAAPTGGALSDVGVLEIQIAGRFGVPADATMVALNLTTTQTDSAGFMTAYPCTPNPPNTSSLNWSAGIDRPNFVLTRLSPTGSVCVVTSVVSDVLVDLAGYVPAGSELVSLASPARVVDTRHDKGIADLPANTTVAFDIRSAAGLPADTGSVFFNVTALGQAAGGFVVVFACDEARPSTSNVNFPAHTDVANFASSRVAANGTICFWSNQDVEVIVDLAAHLPAGVDGYTSLARPARAFDSRTGHRTDAAPLEAGRARPVQLDGLGIPADALAVVANVTADRFAGAGFALMFPCGQPVPGSSNLNFGHQGATANSVLMPIGADNTVCVQSSIATDLIVDVTAYLSDHRHVVPMAPRRIYDSRSGWDARCPFLPMIEAQPRAQGLRLLLYAFDGNIADDRRLDVLSGFDAGSTIATSADCSTVYVTGRPPHRSFDPQPMLVVDVASGNTLRVPTVEEVSERRITPLPDGGVVTVTLSARSDGQGGVLHDVVDVFTGDTRSTLRNRTGLVVRDAVVSADGSRVVARLANGLGREVAVFRLDTGEMIARIPLPTFESISDVDIAPDGRYIAVDGTERDPDGTLIATFVVFSAGTGGFERAGFVDHGDRLVSGFIGNGRLLACTEDAVFDVVMFRPFRVIEVLPSPDGGFTPNHALLGCFRVL